MQFAPTSKITHCDFYLQTFIYRGTPSAPETTMSRGWRQNKIMVSKSEMTPVAKWFYSPTAEGADRIYLRFISA